MELLELLHAIRRRWILLPRPLSFEGAFVAAFILPKNYRRRNGEQL